MIYFVSIFSPKTRVMALYVNFYSAFEYKYFSVFVSFYFEGSREKRVKKKEKEKRVRT